MIVAYYSKFNLVMTQKHKRITKMTKMRVFVLGCNFYHYILCRFVIQERHFVVLTTMVCALQNNLRNKMKNIIRKEITI